MSEHYITLGELLQLTGLLGLPVLVATAVAAYFVLRRGVQRPTSRLQAGLVAVAASTLTLCASVLLWGVLPAWLAEGDALVLWFIHAPTLLSAGLVTLLGFPVVRLARSSR